MRQSYLVAYDIREDKKRARLRKLLKQYGVPVQKSVFSCVLNPKRYQELCRSILPYSTAPDHVLAVRLWPGTVDSTLELPPPAAHAAFQVL